jgi:hypothetical protein
MRSPHETSRTGLTLIPALKILEIAKAIEPLGHPSAQVRAPHWYRITQCLFAG